MPIDPDADMTSVMALYGATMMSVQIFELTLATCAQVLTHEPKVSSKRLTLERTRVVFARLTTKRLMSYKKASASEHMRAVRDYLPEELRARTQAVIVARNELAHRFLREQVDMSTGQAHRFKTGTVLRLLNIHIETTKVTEELAKLEADTRASWPPTEPVPPEVQEFLQEWAKWAVRGDVPSWAQRRRGGTDEPPPSNE